MVTPKNSNGNLKSRINRKIGQLYMRFANRNKLIRINYIIIKNNNPIIIFINYNYYIIQKKNQIYNHVKKFTLL